MIAPLSFRSFKNNEFSPKMQFLSKNSDNNGFGDKVTCRSGLNRIN